MRKLFLAALIGGAIVYFFDREHGPGRRSQAATMWKSQKGTVLEAARTTAGAVSSVSHEVGDRVADLRGTSSDVPNGTAVGGFVGKSSSN